MKTIWNILQHWYWYNAYIWKKYQMNKCSQILVSMKVWYIMCICVRESFRMYNDSDWYQVMCTSFAKLLILVLKTIQPLSVYCRLSCILQPVHYGQEDVSKSLRPYVWIIGECSTWIFWYVCSSFVSVFYVALQIISQ